MKESFLKINNHKLPIKRAYVTLVGVLVVCSVGLVVATSALLLGISYTKSSLVLSQSDSAKSLADACTEDALQRIRDNTSYAGTANLTIDGDACVSVVTAQSGQNRTINSTSIKNGIARKVKATISQISPKILISSWQEVADF